MMKFVQLDQIVSISRGMIHDIVYYVNSLREAAERIFDLFINDKKLSFWDAISYVIVRTVLKDIVCLSFDTDFTNLGLTVIQ
jgi:predicted nucleic acid-binding protein